MRDGGHAHLRAKMVAAALSQDRPRPRGGDSGYYFFVLHDAKILGAALHEYISFIALVGSLYVVSGGIHITVKGGATPLVNTVFLMVGAILANFLAPTGAAMLLIRPWIRMNKHRVAAHHVVFFIFIVANAGGCLTPIGDPPLFLGFLQGIPFWWVAQNCWPMWLAGVGLLLAIFFCGGSRQFSPGSGAGARNARKTPAIRTGGSTACPTRSCCS